VVSTVASEGNGITETLPAVRSFLARGGAKDRAVANWHLRLREMLRERLLERFSDVNFQAAAEKVAARQEDPYSIIDGWLKQFQD
jgi:hypothetical protein